jgi:methylglyoxal/glyoxal reductase
MRMPEIGLGTYQIPSSDCQRIVKDAVRIGYRHIDTAQVYRNEAAIGAAVNELIASKIITREEIWITSKIHPKNQGYENALKSIHESLKALGMEYIDLMLIHWPGSQGLKLYSPQNAINRGGTLRALIECKQKGLIRNIGLSNYTAKHLTPEVLSAVTVNQFEFHPLQWTPECKQLIKLCNDKGVIVQAYSPLGQGELLKMEEVKQIAQSVKCTPAQLMLKWALNKGCVVLPKASSAARLEENFAAMNVVLDAEHEAMVDALVESVGAKRYCWDPTDVL